MMKLWPVFEADLLLFYCENAGALHDLGEDSAYLATVNRAARSEDISDQELDPLPQQRQLVVRETARWSRSSQLQEASLKRV